MKELFVGDSLQNGTMISFAFLRGYTVVLWIVGGIKLHKAMENWLLVSPNMGKLS
jgi:hypothetical protein